MNKAQHLRDKSAEEREEVLLTLKKEIFELRGKKVGSRGDKTHLIRQKKKEIARILTIKRENERLEKK